jgi:hypothetical protein
VWSQWFKAGQQERPEDGATVRRLMRVMYDHERQLEHEENRYELLVDGAVTETDEITMSPSARWYTQEQSRAVFREAGFREVRLTSGFTEDEATGDESLWCARGVR